MCAQHVHACVCVCVCVEHVHACVCVQHVRTQCHPGSRGVVVDPEGDPGQDGDQDGGHVGLQDEVADVPLQLEAQRQAWIGT